MKIKNLCLILIIAATIFGCAQPNEPAENDNNLHIFNILETSGYAQDFDVSDELLFVAEDQRGFSIYNLVSGSMYCHLDTLYDDTPNPYENVRKIAGSVDEDFLMVYDRYGSPASFNIYDISDIQNPQFLFNMASNTSNVQKILLDESLDVMEIFWTNSSSFNVATYENTWTNTATIDFPNSVAGFDFTESLFVVAAYQSGIHIIDRATNQTLITYDTIGEATDVKIVDNYAFIALWEEGYLLLDLTDPTNPIEIHQENVGENIYTIDAKDDKLLLSSHTGGVLLFDVSENTNPCLLGKLSENDIGYTYKASFVGEQIIASTRTGVIISDY
jgi:hypothetical protein